MGVLVTPRLWRMRDLPYSANHAVHVGARIKSTDVVSMNRGLNIKLNVSDTVNIVVI